MEIMRHIRIRIIIGAIMLLSGHCAYASETITERAILNSVKEFSSAQMPMSFRRLWITGSNNDVPYSVWQSIKKSGDRYSVNWLNLTFHDSYRETICRNGILYKCGVIILKINNGEYASLAILYCTDSNEKVINMRDNWSRELSIVPQRAKDALRSLVDKWLSEK